MIIKILRTKFEITLQIVHHLLHDVDNVNGNITL